MLEKLQNRMYCAIFIPSSKAGKKRNYVIGVCYKQGANWNLIQKYFQQGITVFCGQDHFVANLQDDFLTMVIFCHVIHL